MWPFVIRDLPSHLLPDCPLKVQDLMEHSPPPLGLLSVMMDSEEGSYKTRVGGFFVYCWVCFGSYISERLGKLLYILMKDKCSS